jgi:hypothetical protein
MHFGPKIIIEPSFGLASAKRKKQVARMGIKVVNRGLPAYSSSAKNMLNKANALHWKNRKTHRVRR